VTIGAALLLIAVGAILRFAVQTVSTHGFNVHTMGDILMLIGILGLLLWLFIWGPLASLWRSSATTRVPRDVTTRTTEVYGPQRRYRTRRRYRGQPGYPPAPDDTPVDEYPTIVEERDERYR
jgi:hypothetical protein